MRQPVRLRMCVPAPRSSLCDALDTLLDTGIVVTGELIIKVADVELLYVAVELAAGSWESMRRVRKSAPAPLCTGALRNGGEAHGTACSHKPALRAP